MNKGKQVVVGVSAIAAALAVFGILVASGGGNSDSQAEINPSPSAEAVGVAPSNTAEPTLGPIATLIPSAEPSALPDRTDCDNIRGTPYRSEAEQRWFIQNCQHAAQQRIEVNSSPASTPLPLLPPPPAPPPEQPEPTPPPPTATRPAAITLSVTWVKLVSQPPVVCDDSAPVPPASALDGLCIEFQINGVTDGPHQIHYDLNICDSGVASRTVTLTATSGQISSRLGIGKAGPGDRPLTGCDVTIAFTIDGMNLGSRTVHLP